MAHGSFVLFHIYWHGIIYSFIPAAAITFTFHILHTALTFVSISQILTASYLVWSIITVSFIVTIPSSIDTLTISTFKVLIQTNCLKQIIEWVPILSTHYDANMISVGIFYHILKENAKLMRDCVYSPKAPANNFAVSTRFNILQHRLLIVGFYNI